MMLFVQGFQSLTRHMSVDLGRRDIGMTQQELNDTQVGAVIDQMGSKRMAQGVGTERRQAGGLGRANPLPAMRC